MASLQFLVNDSSTDANNPKVQVTITENADGTLQFDIVQLNAVGAYLGDLRGFFFDLANDKEAALTGAVAINQIKNPGGGGSGTATQNNAAGSVTTPSWLPVALATI